MFFGIGFGIFWNWWGMNSGPIPPATPSLDFSNSVDSQYIYYLLDDWIM